jgi:hypothetical protein
MAVIVIHEDGEGLLELLLVRVQRRDRLAGAVHEYTLGAA